MIFIDESAANERTKDRKHGWAPVRPTEHRPHKRSERWSILPAYTSRGGYIAFEIFRGFITKDLFLEFLRSKVMPPCHSLSKDGCIHRAALRFAREDQTGALSK